MELWKVLLIFGIVILIVYFYKNRKEYFSDTFGEPFNKYVEKIYQRSKQIPSYPIDLDRKAYSNNINVKMNRIFGDMVELNNRDFSYPIVFNTGLKPVDKSDETNNTNQINPLIKYLEDKFNTYDSNWKIKVNNVKKIIKHLIDNQLQYDILLTITINIKDINQNIQNVKRDVFMSVVINKYIAEQNKADYDVYIKTLNLANMDHYQYLTGLEKRLNLEKVDSASNNIRNEKKTGNQKEMDGLTHVFDPKYPEYSIYETFDEKIPEKITLASDSVFMPSNNVDRYSNCNPTTVHTEDVLDIFQ
jgi:hypothetical protein